MIESRSALIVASQRYRDPKLRRLRAPTHDAQALASVLADPEIGAFDVDVSLDEPEHTVRRKLAGFFKTRGRDDLLLLHFSCHGLKDEDGQLYFATPDTELEHLDATAVPAEFVNRLMSRSPSRRIVLLLDCCYAGAFGKGATHRAGGGVELKERFDGRGRVVLTASNSMEYAFEGDALKGEGTPSVFTSALVEGLRTGHADRDHDGFVSIDELYDYLYEKVRQETPNQTPSKWTYDVQGDLVVARNPEGAVVAPAELPDALVHAMESPIPHVREGSVRALIELLRGHNASLALAARLALGQLTADDSRRVSSAAAAALGEAVAPPISALVTPPETAVGEEPSPGRIETAAPSTGSGAASAAAAPETLSGSTEDDSRRITDAAARALSEQTQSHMAMDAPVPGPKPMVGRQQKRWRRASQAIGRATREVDLRVPMLALGGATAVFVAYLLSMNQHGQTVLLDSLVDHEDQWLLLSPLEWVGVWLGASAVALGVLRGRIGAALAAGLLLGLGIIALAAALAMSFYFGAVLHLGQVALGVGGLVEIVAGGFALHSALPADRASRVHRAAIALAVIGAGLCLSAIEIDYRPNGTIMDAVRDGYPGEAVYGIVVGVIAATAVAAVAVALLSLRRLVVTAAGLLLAVGPLMLLHFAGVVFAPLFWEFDGLRYAGFVGMLGGALAAFAGSYVLRREAMRPRNAIVLEEPHTPSR